MTLDDSLNSFCSRGLDPEIDGDEWKPKYDFQQWLTASGMVSLVTVVGEGWAGRSKSCFLSSMHVEGLGIMGLGWSWTPWKAENHVGWLSGLEVVFCGQFYK